MEIRKRLHIILTLCPAPSKAACEIGPWWAIYIQREKEKVLRKERKMVRHATCSQIPSFTPASRDELISNLGGRVDTETQMSVSVIVTPALLAFCSVDQDKGWTRTAASFHQM